MRDTSPSTLSNAPPRGAARSNWPAWLVAFATACPAGYLVSVSGTAGFFVSMVAALIVGASTTFAARSRRVLMGAAGNLIFVAASFVAAAVRNARAGVYFSWTEALLTLPVFALFVLVPGLVASAIVARVTRRATSSRDATNE